MKGIGVHLPHSVHPPYFLQEGGEPLTKFSKRGGGLDRFLIFRGGMLEKSQGTFFRGAVFTQK